MQRAPSVIGMWRAFVLAVVLVFLIVSASTLYGLSFWFPAGSVVWARGDHWKTDLVVGGHHYLPTLVDLNGPCVLGPSLLSLPVNGSAVVKNIGAHQCGSKDIGLLEVDQVPGEIGTFLRFDDGSSRTSFYVPRLTYKLATLSDRGRFSGLENTEADAAHIVAFNQAPHAITLTLEIFAGDASALGNEVITVPANGYVFRRITQRFQSGSILVREGSPFGCVGCNVEGPVVAFMAVGPLDGSTARVVPMEPAGLPGNF